MINGRNLFNLLLLISMLVMVILSFDYNPKARLFPLYVGLLTFVMLFWQYLVDQFPSIKQKFNFTKIEKETVQEEKSEEVSEGKTWAVALQCIIAMVGFTILLKFISYLIAVPIFLVLFIWLVGKAKFIRALSISIIMSGFMYVLFDLVLHARI
ncbi:tripartite tricarboxylate transporter TctB family protein [Bacillus sp. Marseille-P3661]|uniref:tripartite tricarboxylate transporter TctB family protein n=1 Tax=Bacillus sp. Marseille-P3661 TaxID=1936234 RepID=UPI000C8288AF|nr:tripartite tricarboxylate transporter TctB family protein [Bacillus sp. Marseille-P3661]